MKSAEEHHVVPRCLLRLHEVVMSGQDLDGESIEAWLEWTDEAGRWGVPVEIGREELEELVERSVVFLDREKHRLVHETDFARWGRRGGRATYRLYGSSWMALLALRRWGLLSAEDLEAARPLR
jgi:hypothetical protein